jgi:hypothetical protein
MGIKTSIYLSLMKKIKRNLKVKRKHIQRKLLIMLHKAFKNKGEGVARMNGII